LAAGFVLRFIFSLYLTYENDFLAWKIWGSQISEVGFGRFYDEFWCDYMPGYLYVLWGLDNLKAAFPGFSLDILFKLPANLADLGISVSIFYALRRITTVRNAMIASIVYLFNPASLSNSTFWGQVDSFHALPILLSIITALGRRFILSGIFAALAFMIKPPSIVVFPLIGLIAIEPLFRQYKKPTIKTFIPALKVALAIVITSVVLTLPFIWDKLDTIGYIFTGPVELIRARFSAAYEQYTYASLNAFNFWGAIAMWQDDSQLFLGISYKSWGTGIFASIYAVIGILLIRVVYKSRGERDKDFSYFIYQAITLIIFSLFLFITRAHERHLLPAIVFFTLLTYRHWILWYLYAIVSLIYVLNMIYSYIQLTTLYKGIPEEYSGLFIPGMFLLYLFIFLYLFYDFIKNALNYKGVPKEHMESTKEHAAPAGSGN
jgi:dolichyl-phosphate-mannose-protein mannosyltransferase